MSSSPDWAAMTRRTRRPRRSREGLTLLELAVLLSVIAVVVAAFVPTFLRELRLSKVGEASENLAEMHRRAAAYYVTRQAVAGLGRRAQCVPEPAGPTPPEPSQQPVIVDFQSPLMPGHETWRALGFSPAQGVRYRYSLEATPGPGCGPREEGTRVELRFIAEGDLDGDGVLSRFERRASNAEQPHELTPDGPLRVQRRVD